MFRTFRGGLLIGMAVAIAVAAAAITYERYDTKTLKRTIKRGEVLCGVNAGLPGFSIPDDKGNWTGFDVDFCRAVAAAIFDDPKKIKFVPLDASERFKELQSRKVDILSRNSTWSMSRETNYDLYFPAVAYYDGGGLHAAGVAQDRLGAGARRQQGLRAGRNDDPAQPRRLFPHQQHEIHGVEVRQVRRRLQGLQCRPVRHLHRRRLAALRAAAEPWKARRPRHPARRHLQGAAGTRGAAARRRLDDDREVGVVCDDQRRGTRHHLQEHRRGAEVEKARRDAAGRHRGRLRRGARPAEGLGRAHHPPCRQLRRDVRSQRRRRVETRRFRAG